MAITGKTYISIYFFSLFCFVLFYFMIYVSYVHMSVTDVLSYSFITNLISIQYVLYLSPLCGQHPAKTVGEKKKKNNKKFVSWCDSSFNDHVLVRTDVYAVAQWHGMIIKYYNNNISWECNRESRDWRRTEREWDRERQTADLTGLTSLTSLTSPFSPTHFHSTLKNDNFSRLVCFFFLKKN